MRRTRTTLIAITAVSLAAGCGSGRPPATLGDDLPLGEVGDFKGDHTWTYAKQCKPIPQREALVDPHITISLDGLTLHLTDRQGSFDRVYPIGAGTIDDRHGSRTYGESRSAYPVFKRGNDFTIDSATINACRIWWSDPDSGKLLPVFAGLPFIRFYGPYGIHGPISQYWKKNGGELHRGYVSHGCIRMEAADVAELWAYIRDTPKVPLHVQLPIERDAAGQALDVSPRFIGAECTDDAQCDFEGGLCQRSGDDARAGFCTKRCDRICPDRLDYPTTYCVDAAKVGASDSSDGRCVPVSNDQSHSCRRFAVLAPSAATPRHGQPEVTRDVCLPAE